VVQYRLTNEYNVESKLEPLDYTIARWVGGGWPAIEKVFKKKLLQFQFQFQLHIFFSFFFLLLIILPVCVFGFHRLRQMASYMGCI
jgi:hypothetical protein